MKKNILIFGINGNVSQALRQSAPESEYFDCHFIGKHQCDFLDLDQISAVLNSYKPSLIINPAAYTAVDKAETDAVVARAINVVAAAHIAKWAKDNNCSLIHFSTDYVFDGKEHKSWGEEDERNPLNIYGVTKAESEDAVLAFVEECIVIRTSWIFYEKGNNFFKTILRLSSEKDSLRIVNDQIGCPTYAPSLAFAVWTIAQRILSGDSFERGIYHLANTGSTTWFDLSKRIVALAKQSRIPLKCSAVYPITTKEYPTPALRPLNTVLKLGKINAAFGIELPPWEEDLQKCVTEYCKYNNI